MESAAVDPDVLAPVPRSFICPITAEITEDPVVTVDGHSFERAAIEEWFQRRVSNPATWPLQPKTAGLRSTSPPTTAAWTP